MIDALQFLPAAPDESLLYVGSYDPVWVVISVLLATFASYAALNAASRVENLHDTQSKLIWTLIGAFTLGIGIWSMHFIGMLAFNLPCGIQYDPIITLISMIPGILASGVALGVVWSHGKKHLSPLISSILLGAGIGTMHYTGMAAMRLDGFVRYDPSLFALSIVVAISLSYLALHVKDGIVCLKTPCNVLVAVIMGSAVSGMHYTAMSAAYFVRGDVASLPPSLFTTNSLAILVAITTVFLALAALTLAAISRNREVTDKLRDSETRYYSALSALSEGVFIQGSNGEILTANNAAGSILGLSVDQIEGRGLGDQKWQATHEDGTPWSWDTHPAIEVLKTGKSISKAIMGIHRPDGSLAWISVNAEPIVISGEKEPHKVVTSFTDITMSKQAESNLRIAAIAFESQEGMMVTDANEVIQRINKAFTESTGYTSEDVAGQTPRLLRSDRQDAEFYRSMRETLRLNGKWEGEIWNRHKDGANYPTWLTISAVKGENNGIVTHYVGSLLDISERKRYESLILENEQRLVDILNVSPIAVRIARKHGREVVFYNRSYADLIKNVHAMGDDPKRYYVHIEDYEEVLTELENGKSVINRQIELKIPDNMTVWTLASYMPIQYKGENAVLGWFYDITSLKAAEEKIRQLAFHDPLTRLPNRQLLLDRLQQALASSTRSGRNGALLFIDLDNFKSLNDTLGHIMGDLLLRQVAQRLTACVREGDTVARLGGDEFVVMLEDLSEKTIEAAEQTEVVGEKVLAALEQPYQLDTHEFRNSASVGATVFNGTQQETEELLKQADIAMYQAKKAGRNTIRFFDPEMQDSINLRVALEGELHKALEHQQFQLHYQIQVDNSRRPLGAEALIRWMHPERGIVSPNQFIQLAEETGLILSIGRWVLDTACAQLKLWESDEATRKLSLAVNVSARQFHQTDFVEQVQSVVQQHAINPNLLKLELTESLLLGDIKDTVITMNGLTNIGVRLSLDDFGTGYSSLQYLKLLPLDQIKIDQSFVRDIATDQNDAAIVQTIIAMAGTLGLEAIAEGVETEAQREFLELRGCQAFQGYLFSKPLPIERFEELIRDC